jgi:hypothetical protein
MKRPITAFIFFVTTMRLWLRYKLPWRTKGYLRDESLRLTDERDANMAAMRACAGEMRKEIERHSVTSTELSDTREELRGERAGRLQLEGQRIEEHQALNRLAFGLAHGLEGTLTTLNEFITSQPDYKPDQAEREEVMQGLTRQVH